MPSRFNPNFDGEDVGELLDVRSKNRAAEAQESQDTSDDRVIYRAPLAPRMTHMYDDSGPDGDEKRPGKDVTMTLSNIFAHLQEAAIALRQMHTVLGQVHKDISPENLLMHYGKDGQIVYLLNDFDTGYASRLNPDFYGPKAKPKEPSDPKPNQKADFEHYTYADLRKHLESIATS